MKATLTFNLPEDWHEHRNALQGDDWACVAANMDEWLRQKLKYGHEYKSIDEALQACRDELLVLVQDNGLSLHD